MEKGGRGGGWQERDGCFKKKAEEGKFAKKKRKKSVLKNKGEDQEDHSLGVFSNPMETF